MTRRIAILFGVVGLMSSIAFATIFGSVRGIIHDPQHRPIQAAMVTLKSRSSDWTKNASTDTNGEFAFNAVLLATIPSSCRLPDLSRRNKALS